MKAPEHKHITVHNRIQQGYTYVCVEKEGVHFAPEFTPDLSPKQMLEMGVFGGKYMTDCKDEFPTNWFTKAKLSPGKKDISLNYFGVDASLPLSVWQQKGWIFTEDPRGWFEWYCRYYMGRRVEPMDSVQIKRWKAIRRHIGGLTNNCRPGDLSCRPRQRQALLHWAYDSRKM